MFIENINHKIRAFFANKYSVLEDLEIFDADEFLEYIKLLEKTNYEFYVNILEAFYPIFYISNLEKIGEIEALKKMEPDYDAEDEFVYDTFFLKNIITLENLIEEIEKDPNMLIDMLYSNLIFHNKSDFEKRGLLVEYTICDKYLMEISKTWIFDRIDYCRKYTKEEFFNRCISTNSSIHCNDYSFEVDNSIEYLREMSIFDIETFLDLFNFILEDSYIYLQYKVLIDRNDLKLIETIEKIKKIYKSPNEDVLNDIEFIRFTIKSFFMYNNLNELEKDKINRFLEKNKVILKKNNNK